MFLDRVENPESGIGTVSGKKDNFNQRICLAVFIEGYELLNQVECRAGGPRRYWDLERECECCIRLIFCFSLAFIKRDNRSGYP